MRCRQQTRRNEGKKGRGESFRELRHAVGVDADAQVLFISYRTEVSPMLQLYRIRRGVSAHQTRAPIPRNGIMQSMAQEPPAEVRVLRDRAVFCQKSGSLCAQTASHRFLSGNVVAYCESHAVPEASRLGIELPAAESHGDPRARSMRRAYTALAKLRSSGLLAGRQAV